MATILGYVNYTTQAGDNWTNIAFKAFGDVQQTPLLLAANRNVGSPALLPPGLVLRVPVIAEADLLDPELLPPWKR